MRVMMEAEKVALQFFHERHRSLLEEKTASKCLSRAAGR